jgi:hypothetical protein
MKFATKALIGLGILAVGALYLKAKFDAAVDAYPDEDFEFDKSLDDKDDTPYNPFDGSDDFLKHDDFAIPRSEQKTDTVAEKPEDEKVEVNKEEKPSFAPKAVVQKDLETGEVIDLFNSVAEAERKTHISRKSISKAANGKAKSAGGFGWEFVTINP